MKQRKRRTLEREAQMWEERFWGVSAVLFALIMCQLGAWFGKWLAMTLSKL